MNRDDQSEAAQRIFDIFTRWMLANPRCYYTTGINWKTGKFEMEVFPDRFLHGKPLAHFQGETIQDCYAQAAQTIEFKGGNL
jgi:hypothetical protein